MRPNVAAQVFPGITAGRRHSPGVELQLACGGAGFGKGVVRTLLTGNLQRRSQCMEVNRLGDLRRQFARPRAVERQAQPEEHILQSHDTQSHGAPAHVGRLRGGDRVVGQINDPIELAHGHFNRVGELLEIEALCAARNADVTREVDRAKVANGGLPGVSDLENLGAQVRQVHRAPGFSGLIACPVRLVLEGHPTVTGLRECAHHPHIQLART